MLPSGLVTACATAPSRTASIAVVLSPEPYAWQLAILEGRPCPFGAVGFPLTPQFGTRPAAKCG